MRSPFRQTSDRNLDSFKPPRQPHRNRRTVPCPVCLAEVGAPCIAADDGRETVLHNERRRLAIRAENLQRMERNDEGEIGLAHA